MSTSVSHQGIESAEVQRRALLAACKEYRRQLDEARAIAAEYRDEIVAIKRREMAGHEHLINDYRLPWEKYR